MQKQCFKCGKVLALAEFYKHPKMSDGHLNKCKNCSKKDTIENRLKNLEYYREYDKCRNNSPKRVEARKEYRKTENGKTAVYQATKNYRVKHPERQKIYRDCEKVLKNPHICSQCGDNTAVEAHHDDYNKPFEVRWLCRVCHRRWHKTHKPIEKIFVKRS